MFFHNFSGYDSHHVMMALKDVEEGQLCSETTVIANSLEKVISMKVAGITLKDSCRLLNCGLDKLVENLKDKGQRENKSLQETFPRTYTYFKKRWIEEKNRR